MTPKEIRKFKKRYLDKSGDWVVVASNGDRSEAVSYDALRQQYAIMRAKWPTEGLRMERVK